MQVRIVTLDDAVEMGGFLLPRDCRARSEGSGRQGTDRGAIGGRAACRARNPRGAARHSIRRQSEEALRALAERLGYKPGVLFGMMRAAITGQAVSPPLFASMEIIGREAFLARLDAAEAVLRKM